jgi:hypothetical protein
MDKRKASSHISESEQEDFLVDTKHQYLQTLMISRLKLGAAHGQVTGLQW